VKEDHEKAGQWWDKALRVISTVIHTLAKKWSNVLKYFLCYFSAER